MADVAAGAGGTGAEANAGSGATAADANGGTAGVVMLPPRRELCDIWAACQDGMFSGEFGNNCVPITGTCEFGCRDSYWSRGLTATEAATWYKLSGADIASIITEGVCNGGASGTDGGAGAGGSAGDDATPGGAGGASP